MTDDDKDLIADLLVRWEEAFDQGQDIPAEDLCTDHPHLTQTVRSKIESLKTTAWTKRDPARPLTDERDKSVKDISGTVLADRYRLDSLLGSGGYGQVYRGHDLKLQRPVAVKIGHHRTSCDLLLDEARRVARLKHPGIVGVHDCGEHDGRMFLVFELVDGQSLSDLARKKKLSTQESVEIITFVAESLHYAHEKGCFHRDIKPENILIDANGKPLIADFGVACTLDELEKGRALSSGTLAYMSPEQVSNEVQLLDGRCDVHALGVVLFELLAGQSPFPAKDKQELREQILFRQPKRLRNVDPSMPEELDAICAKALAKHPGDRHESAAAFAVELRGWLEKSRSRRRTIWIIAAIVLLGLMVAGAVMALGSRPNRNGDLIQNGIMHFDGHTRIVTEVERTLPVTLEAWVKPDPYRDENCQFIIGSDVPGKYGLGIAICGSQLSAEYINGMINSPASVVPGEWSHVASVFTESETRLYLNGKLVANGPGSAEGIPANFVIGNVGQNNLLYYFRGQVRSVRISERERYIDRFKPAAKLIRDETTLLAISEPRLEDEAVLAADGTAFGQAERVGK
ncbi:protein kinase [bacterium]|nr:protein kinase [bacterium]